MLLSDLWLNPSPRKLRQFALIWICFFGVMGVWRGLVMGDTRIAVVAIAISAVGLMGLIRPAMMRWIYLGAIVVTFPLGWVSSRLMLGILFFGLFTPIGLLCRLLGRDPLGLTPTKAATYWLSNPSPQGSQAYFREF